MKSSGPSESTSLSGLQDEIREALHGSFQKARWIRAEINEINENYSGHCYLDLVEKDDLNDNLVARARATIWASTWRMLKPYFETTTGYVLSSGIRVLVKAAVEYHPVYGLSLNIKDIDPSYTLGDVERKRQEIIARLEQEGVMDMNKHCYLPPVAQKIAVISSKTAAGYEDFMEQLEKNPYGYVFYTRLFPAVMQGDKAAESIVGCLERIFDYEEFFDAVVMIRGGGSRADLACFDSYEIAYHVSQFPLPVLTGIGHEQDESITDMVAHTRLKTPTAVAGFLVDRSGEFEATLNECSSSLVKYCQNIINGNKLKLQLDTRKLISGVQAYTSRKENLLLKIRSESRHLVLRKLSLLDRELVQSGEKLKNLSGNIPERKALELSIASTRLRQATGKYLEHESGRLDQFTKLTKYAEPSQILKLGFSISRHNGKAMKDTSGIKAGELIETELNHGKIESKVTGVGKKTLHS